MREQIINTASHTIQMADLKALRALIVAALQKLGLQELDGIPLSEWIQHRRDMELEKMLLAMGDRDPEVHDAIRACIDAAKKGSREF